jgi:hypothetical protein
MSFGGPGRRDLPQEDAGLPHNRFVIGTMAMVPVLFIILPMIQLFAANAVGRTSAFTLRSRSSTCR